MSHVFTAFDRDHITTVTLVDKTTTQLEITSDKLFSVLNNYVAYHLAPVWGCPVKLVGGENEEPITGAYSLVLVDDQATAEGLGYASLTAEGLPQSLVFVKPAIDNGVDPVVAITHELAEMLIDPAISMLVLNDGEAYAYEVCDPVYGHTFNIDGVQVANFVYPAWFESFRRPFSRQFDYMNKCTKPFELLTGGYADVFDGKWTRKFGDETVATVAPYGQRSALRTGILEFAPSQLSVVHTSVDTPGPM